MLRKKLSKSGHHTAKWNVTAGRWGDGVRDEGRDVLENMESRPNSQCSTTTEISTVLITRFFITLRGNEPKHH